jgi:hypothetical protein
MKKTIIATTIAGVMSLFASQASAANSWLIQMDDSTDDLRTYVYENGSLYQPVGDCMTVSSNENCSQSAGFAIGPSDHPASIYVRYNLYEPDGVTLSDYGVASAFFVSDGSLQDFQLSLNSDDTTGSFSGSPANVNLIETGDWQTVATANVTNVDGTVIDTITYQVRSDLDAVPEPLTLSVFGAGLAGCAALRRRKRAK